jgi:hypothetical protein
MNIYTFHHPEGYAFVVPDTPADMSLIQTLDGSPKISSLQPPCLRLVAKDSNGEPYEPSDMPWLLASVPVLRPRAVDALRAVLTEHGELLPVVCRDADLVLFNCTTIRDALDLERSSVKWAKDGRRIIWISSYAFLASNVEGASVFKIPQMRGSPVLFGDGVLLEARLASLQGVGVRKVWEG